VINHMPVTIRTVDRSRKDIVDWWNGLQEAENTYYPNRSRLYDIYKTVELDAHLSGIVEKLIATILNKKLSFVKNKKKDDSFDTLINSINFNSMIRELILKKFWGITGFEFIPGETFAFNLIPRKHIKLNNDTIVNEEYDAKGTSYKGVWNIWVLGDKDDFGIYLKCTPLALWKSGNMGDWAQYIEIFGQPMIIFTYDAHDQKTKTELDTIMRSIGSGTKLQVPKQVELKLEDGKQNNGTGDLQDKFRMAINQELSVLILGATETTTSSSSSGYAQSAEHGQQQDEIVKALLKEILQDINTAWFLQIVKSYGYATDGGAFDYEKEINLNEVKTKLAIAIDTKTKAKVPVGDDYFYELTGIPKPSDYDAQKEEMKQATTPATNPEKPDPVRPGEKGKKKEKKLPVEKKSFMKMVSDFFAEARS
ncbi:MAG: DUF935 family protein, partial [Chitinophagaceae bacterium]